MIWRFGTNTLQKVLNGWHEKTRSTDRAAAYDNVAIIKYRRLAGGNCPLGFFKDNADSVRPGLFRQRPLLFLEIADFYLEALRRKSFAGDKVYVMSGKTF